MVSQRQVKYSLVTLYQRFREIALPRPLPNPPEYVEPSSDSSVAVSWKRIRRGLSVYVDTWRSPREETEVSSSGPDAKTLETRLGTASSVVQQEYGVRIRALQLALKEFVKGFHEGSKS